MLQRRKPFSACAWHDIPPPDIPPCMRCALCELLRPDLMINDMGPGSSQGGPIDMYEGEPDVVNGIYMPMPKTTFDVSEGLGRPRLPLADGTGGSEVSPTLSDFSPMSAVFEYGDDTLMRSGPADALDMNPPDDEGHTLMRSGPADASDMNPPDNDEDSAQIASTLELE